jgi:hypothetical protein
MGGKTIRFFSQIESVSMMNLFEVLLKKANVADFSYFSGVVEDDERLLGKTVVCECN